MAGELKQLATPGSPINNNGGSSRVGAVAELSLGPKRQRRPSVRLGDIGDQPVIYARPVTHHRNKPSSSSKTRPLTNLVNNNNGTTYNHDFSSSSAPATTVAKTKKPRTNTNLRIDHHSAERDTDNTNAAAIRNHNEDFDNRQHEQEDEEQDEEEHEHEEEEEVEEEYRDGEEEGGSPINSGEGCQKRSTSNSRAVRVSELDEGVLKWLADLGLGRYAPVFEIHEVDDEVLPHLTLEDLKDMGINAVGSRRKLYAAILNLRKAASS